MTEKTVTVHPAIAPLWQRWTALSTRQGEEGQRLLADAQAALTSVPEEAQSQAQAVYILCGGDPATLDLSITARPEDLPLQIAATLVLNGYGRPGMESLGPAAEFVEALSDSSEDTDAVLATLGRIASLTLLRLGTTEDAAARSACARLCATDPASLPPDFPLAETLLLRLPRGFEDGDAAAWLEVLATAWEQAEGPWREELRGVILTLTPGAVIAAPTPEAIDARLRQVADLLDAATADLHLDPTQRAGLDTGLVTAAVVSQGNARFPVERAERYLRGPAKLAHPQAVAAFVRTICQTEPLEKGAATPEDLRHLMTAVEAAELQALLRLTAAELEVRQRPDPVHTEALAGLWREELAQAVEDSARAEILTDRLIGALRAPDAAVAELYAALPVAEVPGPAGQRLEQVHAVAVALLRGHVPEGMATDMQAWSTSGDQRLEACAVVAQDAAARLTATSDH